MKVSYKAKVCRPAGTDEFRWELWSNEGYVTTPLHTGTAATKEGAFDAAREHARELATAKTSRTWERVFDFELPDPQDEVVGEVVFTDVIEAPVDPELVEPVEPDPVEPTP